VEQLSSGKVDLMRANAEIYVRVKEQLPSVRPLALVQAQGSTVYQGVIVTRLDSGLQSLKSLEGKTMCWKTLTSNSGYFYPRKLRTFSLGCRSLPAFGG
jgi:ABC-type phosphate/phosphonate transport system substrate-binding protein